MSIFNKNLGQAGLSIQSGVRSNTVRISRWLFVGFLACFFALFFGSGATAQNVLINPGAETGDFTGWNLSGGAGYKFVVSTNQYIPNSAPSNYLAHSGKYTFELFDTTADSSFMYQDFPAIAGSQWSASVYAICYASNYFGPGSVADMQVVFFDTNDIVVPYPPSPYGVLGSQILDPVDNSGFGVTWSTVPPMAVDASGWLYLQPTNLFQAYPATEANYDSTGYPTTLTAPPGTAYVRYQLEYDNSAPPAGQPVYFDDCVLNKTLSSDPDISANPVATAVFGGLPASLSVTSTHTGAHPSEKIKYQWFFNKTNLLAVGMNNISGIAAAGATDTLSFTNLQSSSSGLYSVVVTLTASDGYSNAIHSVPVPLTVQVLNPIQKVNLLGPNAGFENYPSFLPFLPFNGCNFAGPLANPPSTYGATADPVVPYAGSWSCLIGANGDTDNGFHCSVPVTAGQTLKAGGYGFIASTNDFAGGNTCRMQIWFLTASGTPSTNDLLYESSTVYGLAYTNSPDALYTNVDVSSPNYGQVLLHDQLPRDQWVFLGATNITTQFFTAASPYPQGSDLITNTLRNSYFVVPPDATAINYQVYLNVPAANGVASDAIYWDEMRLIQVTPVTDLKATASGGTVSLTFSAGAAQNYTVLYKTNLADLVWNVLSNNVAAPMSWQTNTASVGVTYPVTVTDVPSSRTRFYRVQSQ